MTGNYKKFTVFTDCVNFQFDRPCVYQKNAGVQCTECKHYQKISSLQNKKRILIIKLGAMGDVLRTTFLLQGLKKLYPKSSISWLVNKENSPVLKHNALIDNIVFNDKNTVCYLINNFFDIVINLDLAYESLSFAKLSNNSKILGFTLDSSRNIIPSNEFAQKWLQMSAYDELKKTNIHTYQYWMAKITGLPKNNYEIIVPLQKNSIKKAKFFLKNNNINENSQKKIIAINPGAGKRWKLKKWTLENFIKTAKYFAQKRYSIILFGGKNDENEINAILGENIPNVISAGTNNSVPDFFAKLNLCDVVLCGDTMCLHVAAGLRKNIVALFGPTSVNEINVYSRGVKIQSDKECVVCYKQECNLANNCMKAISVKEVVEAIEQYL